MKNLPKNLIFFGLLILILIIEISRLFLSQAFTIWRLWLPIILFPIGAVLGYLSLIIDRFVDIYFGHPDTKLSTTVKNAIANRQFKYAWLILKNNFHLQDKLTFRSLLFQVTWLFLAFFTLTSTKLPFGKGFVLGLGTHILLDEWEAYLKDKNLLKHWLFWQINLNISNQDLKIYLAVVTILTIYFWGLYLL